MSRTAVFVALGLVGVGALPQEARACGNVTHAWISIEAKANLPPGPIKDLLNRPGMDRYLRNGTMFPDGGYPIGDNYGEMAHWEPFQGRYLEWIRAHYSAPWSDEAAQHIAFLLGMASHGMADQVYDSTFMEASKALDPGWHTCDGSLFCGFDTATDLRWGHQTGPQPNPERWIPAAPFLELYPAAGHPVSEADMLRGSNLVGNAIDLVTTGGPDESIQETVAVDYPFAVAKMELTAQGAPPDIARVVVPYWAMIWNRLNGGDWVASPVLTTLPEDGSYSHVRDHTDVASRVGVVFSRGLRQSELKRESFTLVDSKGQPFDFDVNLFYGESSHVVNVQPKADFAADETYTLSVVPGVVALDGSTSTAPFSFQFSTGAPPVKPPASKKGGCASAPVGPLALLGLALLRRRKSVSA